MPIGNEGSGIVVASGGGLGAWYLGGLGRKVGFVGLAGGQGSYSEYVTVNAMRSCFPMPNDLDVEAAASFFVNPYSVCQ